MDTYFWGPSLWTAMHAITFDYPEQPTEDDKKNYRQFFHSLKTVLPCDTCRQHYSKGIETTLPIDKALQNRDSLTRWLVNFHNIVNERLGKPIVPYDNVKEKYEAMRGKCQIPTYNLKSRKKTDNLLYLIILLLMVMILLVVYYLSKLKMK